MRIAVDRRLLGRPGLATDHIAGNRGAGAGALFDVELEEVAHHLAGLLHSA